MIPIAYGVGITLIWVMAWGSFSAANVLGGVAIAALLLWFAPDTWPRARPIIRPVAIGRFTVYVAGKMMLSNVSLVRDVVARRSRIHSGVMAVSLPTVSDGLLTVITSVMALSPGTIPLHVTRDPMVLYVHVLHMRDVEAARRSVLRLVELAYGAFAPAGAVEALEHHTEPTS